MVLSIFTSARHAPSYVFSNPSRTDGLPSLSSRLGVPLERVQACNLQTCILQIIENKWFWQFSHPNHWKTNGFLQDSLLNHWETNGFEHIHLCPIFPFLSVSHPSPNRGPPLPEPSARGAARRLQGCNLQTCTLQIIQNQWFWPLSHSNHWKTHGFYNNHF